MVQRWNHDSNFRAAQSGIENVPGSENVYDATIISRTILQGKLLLCMDNLVGIIASNLLIRIRVCRLDRLPLIELRV